MIAKTLSARARACAPMLAGILVAWLALMPALAAAQTTEGMSELQSAADMLNAPAVAKRSGLTFCHGDFALCAASSCMSTGGKIKVNGKNFPAALCECPILNGWSIADLNSGNMTGSCDPPPNGVWSLYFPLTEVPQEYTTPPWQTVAATPGLSRRWKPICPVLQLRVRARRFRQRPGAREMQVPDRQR